MANYRFPITNVEGDLVAQHRDPNEKLYASLELNQVAFPKTGMVVSQTPLGDDFADAPCENGMWVVADKAKGVIQAPTGSNDEPIGIVYTTEKEYDREHYGLQRFGRKVAGDYPRVGLLGVGDTVTTNCLQYDDTVFAATQDKTAEEVLLDALKNIDKAPLYVCIKAAAANAEPTTEQAVPQIVKAAPQSGIYGKIVKFYTVPNGGLGVKYQIIKL
jgi:hypothetical protein